MSALKNTEAKLTAATQALATAVIALTAEVHILTRPDLSRPTNESK